MQIHQLVYQSRATFSLSASELQRLLGPWRARNHSEHISGLLLYGDEYIVQVIEGPPAAVRRLYAAIARDVRHYDVLTLHDGPVAGRAFAEWNMGFAALAPAQRTQLAGHLANHPPLPALPDEPRQWPALTALLQEFAAQQELD